MDIGRFIGNLITIGFILATMGTLAEVTTALTKEGRTIHKQGIISIGAMNRCLLRGK